MQRWQCLLAGPFPNMPCIVAPTPNLNVLWGCPSVAAVAAVSGMQQQSDYGVASRMSVWVWSMLLGDAWHSCDQDRLQQWH